MKMLYVQVLEIQYLLLHRLLGTNPTSGQAEQVPVVQVP